MDPRAAYWQCVLGAELAPARIRLLTDGNVRDGYPTEPRSYLSSRPGLTDSERKRLSTAKLDPVTKAVVAGVRVLERQQFPVRLAQWSAAPPALFVWGDPSCLEAPTVAVVGTRAASVYGKAAAQKFAEALAEAGITVVSGGALGIDAAAHEAVLAAGGKTAAVLAGGVDRAYPAVHRGLFRRIREGGCLLSPFALGTLPRRGYFLSRNSLVAALSDAVLVVEAPEKSGSLSTANAAADLGRQVFVVPANVSALTFRGSHDLIRSGATLVDHPDQVLLDMGIKPKEKKAQAKAHSEEQALILSVLSVDPTTTERIAGQAGLEPSAVLAELTMLELEGLVIRAAGGYALRP